MATSSLSPEKNFKIEYGNFLGELTNAERFWLLLASRYGRAYKEGYDGYINTLGKPLIYQQLALDAAVALVVAAATQTGALMLASFGASSLRTLLVDKALHAAAALSLHRTFRTMYFFSHNGPSVFAFGLAADGIESVGKKIITAQLEKSNSVLGTWGEGRLSPKFKPEQAESLLKDFVRASNAEVGQLARELKDDAALSWEDKMKALEALRTGPIGQNPPMSQEDDDLGEKMELCFLLTHLLRSNFLRDRTTIAGDHMPSNQQRIDAMPNTPDYPPKKQYFPPNAYRGPVPTVPHGVIREQHLDGPGYFVSRRINDLWAKYIDNSAPLFPKWKTYYDPKDTETLYKAKAAIAELSFLMRPTKAFPIKF